MSSNQTKPALVKIMKLAQKIFIVFFFILQ